MTNTTKKYQIVDKKGKILARFRVKATRDNMLKDYKKIYLEVFKKDDKN